MKHLPKITIVTPSYNQGAFIEEALWSVKNQRYPSVEHLVIDGGSTDETVEILKGYSSQRGWEHLRWVSEADRGQSDALNKGFRMATGEIVGWLNSDDRYRSGCFRAVVDGFANTPGADLLYGDYTYIDETGRVFKIRREIGFSRFILYYHRVLYVPTTSTFFRRRIFDEENWIDLRFHYAMDYEFFLRLADKGYRFRHVPKLLADFRWHRDSKSGAHPEKQFVEHDAIATSYSRILRNLKSGVAKRLVLSGLRATAAGLRYSQKLVRGYYFKQDFSSVNDGELLDCRL